MGAEGLNSDAWAGGDAGSTIPSASFAASTLTKHLG